MLPDNYMKLAMILQSSPESDFKSHVRRIIEAVLYYHNKDGKNSSGLNLFDLRSQIENLFALEFTEEELCDVIENNPAIEARTSRKNNEIKYRLTSDAFETTKKTMTEAEKRYNLKNILQGFITTYEKEIIIDDLEKLIMGFLYNAFYRDVSVLSTILNSTCVVKDIAPDFTEEQKEMINDFLSWDNNEKNEFVCNLVSLSYQYCSLNVDGGTNLTSDILKNKVFYLDTNIIFRLIGINNKERQGLMNSFIEKCKVLELY